MCRVKAFITASNEHRSHSIGGRRQNRVVDAWLNTDNHTNSNCGMNVSARVYDRDQGEHSAFDVDLPFQPDQYCSAFVSIPGGPGAIPRGKITKRTSYHVAMDLVKDYNNVVIPGGYRLDHALACIAMCEAMGLTPDSEAIESLDDLFTAQISDKRRGLIRT
jgi:hypothetical protein